MRFFGFFLGLCEANAYAAFRKFSADGQNMDHAKFKDNFAFYMLRQYKNLETPGTSDSFDGTRTLRSTSSHLYVSMSTGKGSKRIRLACNKCSKLGVPHTRVEKSCSCNPAIPLCEKCYIDHLQSILRRNI